MDRRAYLALTAATSATLAGCESLQGDGSDSEDDDGDGEDGDDGDDTSTPSWRQWIPADLALQSDAEVLTLDIDRARSELPDQALQDLDIRQISSALGVEESALSRMSGMERGPNTFDVALEGTFSPDDVVENVGASPSETESYGGFTVISGQVAVSNSAVVVSDEYETVIDTRTSGSGFLGDDDDDWDTLLRSIEDGTLAVAAPGTVGEESDLDANATKSGVQLDAADGGGAVITLYIHFPSESDAESAMDTAEAELAQQASGNSEIEITSTERDGSRIIIEGTAPNFDF